MAAGGVGDSFGALAGQRMYGHVSFPVPVDPENSEDLQDRKTRGSEGAEELEGAPRAGVTWGSRGRGRR